MAFTIFRDEFDAPFVVMFGVLLFLKCFHWLIADRMDWVFSALYIVLNRSTHNPLAFTQMDQQPYPGPPMLFHLRSNVMFFILWTIDMLMLEFAIESVLAHGVGGIVLFGSEYAILLASCLNSILKYFVMVYDLRRARTRGGEDAPVWQNKGMYVFYIELITGKTPCRSILHHLTNIHHQRLPQTRDISHILYNRHDLLRSSAQYHPRRLHDRRLVLHSFPRPHALPCRNKRHGNQISKRHSRRARSHVR